MADFVIHVANDEQYPLEMARAGDKLIVVDFFATWCGPCQRVAPFYSEMSVKYRTSAVFLKIDVDQCTQVAAVSGVSAMPTFMFFKNNQKLGEMKGANTAALEDYIKRFIAGNNESVIGAVPGHDDLVSLIQTNQMEVLNESDNHTSSALFNDDSSYLESDCDEQLIISIPFSQPVKIHSMRIVAPNDGTAPKDIKIFINQANPPSFDEAESLPCVQSFCLTPDDVKGTLLPFMFVRFQNVQSITLFVGSNQGSCDTTKIKYLELIGSPTSGTNMNEFKR
eukprot:Ihof_evm2s481 gene=Ihof_evmTU2s481